MGLGGYLAGKTDENHFQSEQAREHQEVRDVPEREAAEIRDLLADYGVPAAAAEPVVEALRRDPAKWVAFMMRFELGLEKPDPRRAFKSAFTIAGAYIAGGMVPLVPYMVVKQMSQAVVWSIAVTLLALGIFGFVKARLTGINPLRGAVQTILIGGIAAGAAFGIARLFSQ